MRPRIFYARLKLMDLLYDLAQAVDPGHRWMHGQDGDTLWFYRVPEREG